jgi:mRNA-degrading endonuclease RelE of RelBE toxin-antitoxin system
MTSKIILTDSFKRDAKKLAKKHRSLGQDIRSLIKELQSDPYLGNRLTPNVYKVRIAIKSKGKGKSGGGRVIYYVNISLEENGDDGINVYLLAIYDKSSMGNIPTHIIDSLIKDSGIIEEEE